MAQPVIAEEYRGGYVENMHQGIIAVMNDKKEIIYEKGDADQFVYYRSAMKPIQAIPAFSTDIIEKYNLTYREAALFTASQRGEDYHQKTLKSLLEKLKLREDYLVCSPSYPLNEEPYAAYLWDHKEKRRLFHNCAGKHLGILAYAREKGLPLDGYEKVDHPVQQEILQLVSELSEIPVDEIHHGTDGCRLPIYGVPLKNMSLSYLKFAAPDMIQSQQNRDVITKIGTVMNEHPDIVASHDFICTTLLEDSNIVAKGGAQGVYCLALRKERLSIALKVLSGTELLWPVLVADILEKLNYDNQETIDRLRRLSDGKIRNDSGHVVGDTKILL